MVLPFLGFFFNELSKGSLIGEKLHNLVTLLPDPALKGAIPQQL
jgi:hypothetical protein